MAHVFTIHTMTDGKFGPTKKGHFYQPMGYHNPSGAKKKGKTKWTLNQSEQYEVFQLSDEATKRLFVKNSGLYGLLEEGEMALGENDECLAFFPCPANDSDPWHGYPVFSKENGLTDELIDEWLEQEAISVLTYQRLMHQHI